MTITEVSKKYNLPADTLRYYERIGLIPRVTRNSSGIRDYQEKDLRRIEFVKCMRQSGVAIELLKKYFKLAEKGDDTIALRKEMLVEQRDRLKIKMDEMQETFDRLEYKISIYDDTLQNFEQVKMKEDELLSPINAGHK